jgi:hypothetical protein
MNDKIYRGGPAVVDPVGPSDEGSNTTTETQTKKFLDYEGVKYLWSKISMEDYPNNETLMDVIEAIDETKADKSEIVQSDWN